MEPGAPRSKKYYFGIAAAVVAVLAVAALLARPVYHRVKLWRALQLTDASVQALRANDLSLAREDAQVAVELWPYDARVLRQAATINSLIAPRRALPFWLATWYLSRKPDDRRGVVLAAIAANDLSFAAEQMIELKDEDPNNPLTDVTEAKLRLTLGQWPEALLAAQRALKGNPVPDDAHFLYAEAAQSSPDPQVRAAGLDHLRLLSTRSDALGLRALRQLAQSGGSDFYQMSDLAQRLQDHPLATADDKLLALGLRARLPGADQDALLASATELFPPSDPTNLVTLGHWLMNQGRYADVLTLIDTDTAFKRRDLFLIRLDAMAITNQWQAIQELLNRPNVPLEDELRLLFLARTQSELGGGPLANLAWDRVQMSVQNDPTKLRDFAIYAAKLHLDDIARPAFQSLLEDPGQRRTAYEQLLDLERRDGHTAVLHQLLSDMLRFYPSDPAVHNDYLYTGFLLGSAGDEQLAAARQLVTEYPNVLSYRVTLALGYLAADQPAAALNVFLNLPINWSTVSPSWRAIFDAVLRANHHAADAAQLEKLIPPAALLPEERALLGMPAPPPAPAPPAPAAETP